MNRRLVTLAAAGSLLLCVATVALWVRSYFRGDGLYLHTLWGDRYTAASHHGTLFFERHENVLYRDTRPLGLNYRPFAPPRNFSRISFVTPRQWRFAGFG
jgi:hypothetical protein